MRLALHNRLPAALLAALALSAPAAAATRTVSLVPAGLHGFLLRADEPLTHTFSRTPSFAWPPVPGAERYEFELATSPGFDSGTIVWADATLRTPATSVPYSLPWLKGSPFALYAHVRAWSSDGPGAWRRPFGFNLGPTRVPSPLTTYPGLLSWSTVPGATSYDVWLTDAHKVISTRSNVADEREYYDFHQQPGWSDLVHWRVRAVRSFLGTAPGLPAVSRGPWSKVYTSANPARAAAPLKLTAAFSDVTSSAAQPETHRLTPGFAFTGNRGLDGKQYELFRVYVFTDRSCVGSVFTSAIVGSPAYAPRTTGPVRLPGTSAELAHARTSFLPDGAEPASSMADATQALPTEQGQASPLPATDTGSEASAAPGTVSPATSGDPASLPPAPQVLGAPVDLWDSTPDGSYYWTVVPVELVQGTASSLAYRDAELPSAACAAGRVASFRKLNAPVLATASLPYASGLSPAGRLITAVSSLPSFYGTPLVAWQPAIGADEYQVQWSRTKSPWATAGQRFTYATSTELDQLVDGSRVGPDPGSWYYRVRGLDFSLPGTARTMSWSEPVPILIAKPIFRIVP